MEREAIGLTCISLQQPYQHVLLSRIGIGLSDHMRVPLSGAMTPKVRYGKFVNCCVNVFPLCFVPDTLAIPFLLSLSLSLSLSCFLSYGLPTRSRQVAEFMTGLEKTKARAGEMSSSARALTINDIHRLYDQCMPPLATDAVLRQGSVRYVSFPWFSLPISHV